MPTAALTRGAAAEDLLGALKEAVAADEQPHDTDLRDAARFESVDAALQVQVD